MFHVILVTLCFSPPLCPVGTIYPAFLVYICTVNLNKQGVAQYNWIHVLLLARSMFVGWKIEWHTYSV